MKLLVPGRATYATLIALAAIALTSIPAAHADDAALDGPSQEALQKTQAMLRDPKLRAQAIKGTEGASAADAEVQGLAAQGVDGNALYGISADIFEDLAKQSGGDPIKMQQLLEQAKRDPKAFAERLSAKSKNAIRELSSKSYTAPAPSKP